MDRLVSTRWVGVDHARCSMARRVMLRRREAVRRAAPATKTRRDGRDGLLRGHSGISESLSEPMEGVSSERSFSLDSLGERSSIVSGCIMAGLRCEEEGAQGNI